MMMRDKLLRTIKQYDDQPGAFELPANADGVEAALYIDNMVHHFGAIMTVAFQHIKDDDVRTEIRKHALAAIKGEK